MRLTRCLPTCMMAREIVLLLDFDTPLIGVHKLLRLQRRMENIIDNKIMPTNTNDPYVPALSRHIFTAGGCSSGSHDQPSFSESSDAFTESWDGYIYVPNDIDNCVLKVSADDNAQFYLYAFPDKVADLPGRGPMGGGNYESAESEPIEHLKKGYYRVHVSYENIDYPKNNVARLEVLLNGSQISIGQLETHNKLTEEKAKEILQNYRAYSSYEDDHEAAAAIWALFGEKAKEDMGATDTCATRVSIALSRSGYTLTGAHYSDGSSASNNVVNRGWDATILNADGSSTKRHIIMSAAVMSQFYSTVFGDRGADYDDSNDYEDYTAEAYEPKPGDIVIFGDSLHVGICPGTEPDVGSFMTGQVRLLYRESWGS